jgi:type I restriction enzyme R subunit
MDEPLKESTANLVLGQINALRETGAITVREHWKELELLASLDTIKSFSAVTRGNLRTVAAPLMRLVSIRGDEAAYKFDLLATRLQSAQLQKTPAFDDLKAAVEEQVEALPKNLNQIIAKGDSIQKVRAPEFWAEVSCAEIEALRQDLRGVMKHQSYPERLAAEQPKVFDFRDGERKSEAYETKLKGLNLVQYRNRVKKALEDHFKEHLVYRKIRSNIRVSDEDLEKLAQLVLSVDAGADLHRLVTAEEERFRGQLYFALKSVVGLDKKEVDENFQRFVGEFPQISVRQLTFLGLIKSHICQHGLISLSDLDEGQFIQFESSGLEGVFPNEAMLTRLLTIISTYDPDKVESVRSA